ncbi:MAG TPA: response regulator transcription factor [Acidobacteriaceae bacterium]|nr:response regulator transcription factor [Acidobacteriaceae bacterium]
MQVLIVEDKRSLAGHLGRALEDEGYSITLAYDGEEGLRLGRSDRFDLLILDVMLPRIDGFTIIRKLREDRLRTQTIILSARDSMSDVVQGLDAGADDYLTKPFALDVLLARMRAAARRVAERPPEILRAGDLLLRPQTWEFERAGRVEPLTRTEYALLETLVRRAGSIVPRQVLIHAGWGPDSDIGFESLYVFIRSLRAKITHPGEAEILHTVRGVGYTLRPDA